MKKIMALILVLVLALSFAGCGEKASNEQTSSGEVVLEVYQLGTKPDDWDEVLAAFNEKIYADLGFKTTWEFISSGSYTEKMNIIMAASEEFDVCFTGFANPVAAAVRNGGFIPLDDLIEEHVPELKDTMPDYWWKVATFDGQIYAVPNQQVAAMPSGVWVYKRLADKYNLDMTTVKGLKDIEPMLEIIKENEPGLWGYRAHPGTKAYPMGEGGTPFLEATSGLVMRKGDSKAQLMNYFEQPEYLEAVEILNRWWKKGYIRKDIVSVMDDNNDFKGKKYAFDTGNWKPGVEVEILKNQGEEIVYSVYTEGMVSTSSCDSTMFAISRTSKHPVESIKFINYINTNVEAYNLLATGIEGKHYDMLEDGRIRIREGNTYPIGGGWKWGNQFNAYVTDTQDIDVWEQTKKLNEEAKVVPLMGFRVDSTPFLAEKAQVSGVLSEFSSIQYRDFEKLYPEFLKRLKEAGQDVIKKEYQKQIDEFLKNKK